MPRSNWKGYISFGLVSVPVVLYNSEDRSQKVSFHQVDKRNNARIKYQRINTETGEEVPWQEIRKAYAYDKDIILPVDDDELKKVAGENARTIAIENFINKNNIDFVNVEKTYYLLPDKKGEKGYVILRQALKESNKIGIAKVIISTKEYLAAIAYYNNALVLYLLRYQNEIKPLSDFDLPPEDIKKSKVTAKEVTIAKQLIDTMTTKWKPEQYKDEYEEAVHKWAEQKIKHLPVKKMHQRITREKMPAANMIDLLRKSLVKSKKPKAVSHVMNKKQKTSRRVSLH